MSMVREDTWHPIATVTVFTPGYERVLYDGHCVDDARDIAAHWNARHHDRAVVTSCSEVAADLLALHDLRAELGRGDR